MLLSEKLKYDKIEEKFLKENIRVHSTYQKEIEIIKEVNRITTNELSSSNKKMMEVVAGFNYLKVKERKLDKELTKHKLN